tara:strand:+ start:6330 stop:6899 length:570 start_codon:yes stop_codon:yes gene_type:complete
MKNIFLITLFLCSTSLSAQSDGPGQVVKANPFGFFAGQYQIGYEQALTEQFSLQLSAGIMTGSGSADDPTSNETLTANRFGFIVMPEFRFYPGGNACEGFYIAALARYRTVKWEIEGDEWFNRNVLGAAAVLGYQWYGDGLMVDMFLGPQVKSISTDLFDETVSEQDQSLFPEGDGIGVRFGMNVGFGW